MNNPHIMIVRAPYYQEIADKLLDGAKAVLDDAGATYEVVDVPSAFEIPGAIRLALKGFDFYTGRKRFDGYVTLGCVIRGETSHYDHICDATFKGLQDMILNFSIAVGNGILTCENEKQALARANKGDKDKGMNKGGEAAKACLSMLETKRNFGLYPRD